MPKKYIKIPKTKLKVKLPTNFIYKPLLFIGKVNTDFKTFNNGSEIIGCISSGGLNYPCSHWLNGEVVNMPTKKSNYAKYKIKIQL